MTPGPDGGVYVAIQGESPVVLALVGTDGAVRPGWPIMMRTRSCVQLLTAADGTLRAICDGTPEGDLGRSIDNAHAATAGFRLDAVTGEGGAGRECGG